VEWFSKTKFTRGGRIYLETIFLFNKVFILTNGVPENKAREVKKSASHLYENKSQGHKMSGARNESGGPNEIEVRSHYVEALQKFFDEKQKQIPKSLTMDF